MQGRCAPQCVFMMYAEAIKLLSFSQVDTKSNVYPHPVSYCMMSIEILKEKGLFRLATNGIEIDYERGYTYSTARSPFLEHTLRVNDVCIAFALAVQNTGYRIDKWLREDELRAARD